MLKKRTYFYTGIFSLWTEANIFIYLCVFIASAIFTALKRFGMKIKVIGLDKHSHLYENLSFSDIYFEIF
jgi:uncharacterized paraquat-inducible protein A